MDETYLKVLDCLGAAMVDFLDGMMDFNTWDTLGMALETGLTLVLMNVKGWGGGGGGEGALREPIDVLPSDVEI